MKIVGQARDHLPIMENPVPISADIIPIPADHIDSRFAKTTNLASSALNSKILACSDEFFAAASNLLTPTAPIHRPGVFVHTGAWYDGWETRRHNQQQYDWVVIKLGAGSGVVQGVEIDTAYFVGNYGEKVLVEGAYIPDHDDDSGQSRNDEHNVCSPHYTGWTTVLPLQSCGASRRQAWALQTGTSPLTHIRVRMYPDGGFARVRLYGHAIAPPLPATITNSKDTHALPVEELSSALFGAVVTAASNQHFTPASNILLPGRGVNMGDGWETARSRAAGHVDWTIIRLGHAGSVEKLVVDTKDFRGNFPRAVRVHGIVYSPSDEDDDAAEDPAHDHPGWVDILNGDRPCKADAEHVFEVEDFTAGTADVAGFTHVKLTLVPDGGVKRLRVFGRRQL